MLRSLAVLALAAVPLGGCDLYFGGDDEPPCAYGAGGAVAPDVANGYRNPYSGQCEYYGGPYYPCDDACGPCPAADVASPPYDYASCYSQCEGLTEDTCAGESGCYVAYLGDATKQEFLGCYATAPSGPVQGSCTNLDAYACSRHDNCSALYSPMGGQHFIKCMEETTSSCECGPGYRCEQQCDANAMCDQVCVSNQTCASVDCAPGYTCAQTCTNGVCGPTCLADPAACSTLTTEQTCASRADCTPVYAGTDCTCYPTHCVCKILDFERCEAL